MPRTIREIVTGSTQYDGAGVKLVRVIGHANVKEFDPFLMLDAFDSHDPADYVKGFPWHPHRGIETVTYLIHGNIEHGDSLGNKGAILDGCCQWMTAGKGILHQEMPQSAQRMLGVQLWLNLPKAEKMTEPQYRDIRAEAVPLVQGDGAEVHVISGTYGGVSGAVQGDYVKALFLDVTLLPHAKWELATQTGTTLFLYIVEGEASFDGTSGVFIPARRAVLFNDGDQLFAQAGESGARFLLFCGKPLKEPIAWGGPIVMNTQEELEQAFRQLRNGTFIR